MNSSATRGAVLVALAALLGFLILRGVADNDQIPLVTGAEVVATATAVVEVTPDAAVAVAEPTAEISTATARDNSQVTVLVANGTEVSGQAGRLTNALRNQGFVTRDPKTADPRPASVIYYRPGFAAEAQVVRNVLGGTTPLAPMPEPDPILGDTIDLAPVNVLVLIGDDALSTS